MVTTGRPPPRSAPLPAPQPAPRNLSIAAPSTSGRQEVRSARLAASSHAHVHECCGHPAPVRYAAAHTAGPGCAQAPYELPWLATCHQASSNSWALAAAEWQLVGAHAALARERARALRCAGLQLLRSVGSLWPRALLARNLRQEPEPFEAELDAEDLEDEEFEVGCLPPTSVRHQPARACPCCSSALVHHGRHSHYPAQDLGDWDDVELEELELEEFDDLGSGDAPPSTSSGGKGSP